MKFLVVFVFCVFVALSHALLKHHDHDDPEYKEFEARLRKMGEAHAFRKPDGKPFTRKEIATALEQFLPTDPDEREVALGQLFMELMHEGPFGMGEGHDEMGHVHGRRGQPATYGRLEDDDLIPSAR